jgi:hypothetical protein
MSWEEKMQDNDYRVVGKPVPRIDGKVKVTGTATFADDLFMPRMLHGKLLRSPYAHARIKNIDTSKAEKLSGVRAVITGKDFPGIVVGFMKQYADRPRMPSISSKSPTRNSPLFSAGKKPSKRVPLWSMIMPKTISAPPVNLNTGMWIKPLRRVITC